MRILLINYRYFISGGPERYMFNIKEKLEEKGHDVIPFSIKSEKNIESKYDIYFADPIGGQDVHYYHEGKKNIRYTIDTISRLFYSFHVKNKLSKLIEQEKPDVAYILHHYNKLSPSVISACKKNNIRIVMRLSDYFLFCPQAHFLRHGVVCEECIKKSLLSCIQYKCVKNSKIASLLKASALYLHKKVLKLYDNVDTFVCTTEFMKSKLVQDGVENNRITVIPTFTKILCGSQSSLEKNYILYFGRFSYEKGVDILLRSFYKSKLYESGVRLVLVGGRLSEIKGISEEVLKNINNYVDTYEFLSSEKLEPIIQECMYTVVPSRWYENLPNTILESYKYKKPVIASNLGSLPEVVDNNITGLIFNNEDVDDLATKLQVLSSESELRMEMKLNIVKKLEDYSSSIHYDRLIKTFEK